MSAHEWRRLVREGNLKRLLLVFGVHVVELILDERRRT